MTEKWPFLAIRASSFPALATRERSAVDRNRLKHMHSNCPKGQKHHLYTPQYGQKGDLRTPPVWPALEMIRTRVATFCELKAARPLIPRRSTSHKALKGQVSPQRANTPYYGRAPRCPFGAFSASLFPAPAILWEAHFSDFLMKTIKTERSPR